MYSSPSPIPVTSSSDGDDYIFPMTSGCNPLPVPDPSVDLPPPPRLVSLADVAPPPVITPGMCSTAPPSSKTRRLDMLCEAAGVMVETGHAPMSFKAAVGRSYKWGKNIQMRGSGVFDVSPIDPKRRMAPKWKREIRRQTVGNVTFKIMEKR